MPTGNDLARRRALTAALGFALLHTRDGTAPPETKALREWLDTGLGLGMSWPGSIVQESTADHNHELAP